MSPDLTRIVLGEVPWSFLIECVIRITFLYFLIVFAMRLMGARMVSAVSRTELAALASVAGATGVPMQVPDAGLLPTFVAVMVVTLIQRSVARLTLNHKPFEVFIQGEYYTMVSEGRMILKNMSKSVLTKDRLFSQLRSQKIDNLGRVRRCYMEANGAYTVITYEEPRPGLSIAPTSDREYIAYQPKAPGIHACSGCGALRHQIAQPTEDCSDCGCSYWTPAVLT